MKKAIDTALALITLVAGALVLDHVGYARFPDVYRGIVILLRDPSIELTISLTCYIAMVCLVGFLVSLPVWILGWWLKGIPERRAEKRRNKMWEALGVTEKIKAIRAAEEKKRSSEQNL